MTIEKLFKYKIVSSLFFSFFFFCNSENEAPIHPFYSCNQTKSLWGLNYKSYWTQKYLFHKIRHGLLSLLYNKESFEIINHLHLIVKYYLFKFWDTRKISLDGLKENITKIYDIDKQICFKNSKKEAKLKTWHIIENLLRWTKFTAKSAWVRGGNVNISI